MTTAGTTRRNVMEVLNLTETMVDYLARLAADPGWRGLPRQKFASTIRALRERRLVIITEPSLGPELTSRGRTAAKLLGLIKDDVQSPAAGSTADVAEFLAVARAALAEVEAVVHTPAPVEPPAPSGPIEMKEFNQRVEAAPLAKLVDLDIALSQHIISRARAEALAEVLTALDGWIEGEKANHVALDHRNESAGSECWNQFHPDDIRRMVADAARVLGVGQ